MTLMRGKVSVGNKRLQSSSSVSVSLCAFVCAFVCVWVCVSVRVCVRVCLFKHMKKKQDYKEPMLG